MTQLQPAPIQGIERFLVLLCVSVPSFMINLDANIVAVSLPSIAHSLKADFAAIEWVISAYTLAFATLLMPAGALADRYGRKRMLLIGLVIFSLASLVCGAARTAAILDIARGFQGLGAAVQLSGALATLSHVFRGAERARAFAFWGAVIGIGVALGPLAGGMITQWFGWQWAFYINVPIGIVMVFLTFRAVPESNDPAAQALDISGTLTFAGSLLLATLALISGNKHGWDDEAVLGELLGAVALAYVFIVVERRQPRPMLDLSLFLRPTYLGACIAGAAFAAALLTMLTYLPMYFQAVHHHSPLVAGLAMLPIALPMFLVPRLVSAQATHVFSGRILLCAGLGLVAVGMACLGLATRSAGEGWLLPGMLIAGAGAGVLNGETAKVAMTVIAPERAGMASGMSATMRFSGVVIGFALLGAVLFAATRQAILFDNDGMDAVRAATLAHAYIAGNSVDAMHGAKPAQGALAAGTALSAGYRWVMYCAAGIALLGALGAWTLVRDEDAPPTPRS